MTWSSLLTAFFALSCSSTAQAGACCVGSVAASPARVGECEKAIVALALTGESTAALWDRDGTLRSSSLQETSATANLGIGARVSRQLQLQLSVPARLNHMVTGAASGWGSGLGDARLTALWDPREEMPSASGGASVPIVTAGLRLPTGRDWTESNTSLHEDVTGLEQPAVIAGAALERTLDRWPWSIGSTAEVGFGSPGVQPVVQTVGSLGRYLGSRWTVSSALVHQIGWASIGNRAAMQTSAGLSVIHGAPGRWRGWLGVQAGIPISGLGMSSARRSVVSTGFAVVL